MSESIRTVKFCGGEWKARRMRGGAWYVFWSDKWEEWPRAVSEGWLLEIPSRMRGNSDFYLTMNALKLAQEAA